MMWDLPKGDRFLPRVNLGRLENLYRTEEKAKPKIRLLCAIGRKKGESIDEIARMTDLKRRTVHDILHRFCDRGVLAKDSIKQEGRPAFLSMRERKTIVKALERGPPGNKTGLWTTKEVKDFIKKKYNITYSNGHVWELLRALGLTLQRPRPRHYKHPTDDETDRFKKKLPGWHAIIDKEASQSAAKTRRPSVSSQ